MGAAGARFLIRSRIFDYGEILQLRLAGRIEGTRDRGTEEQF
jgi:hypothetical protein